MKNNIPMNLQLFAEDPITEQTQKEPTTIQVDYERIQQMLNGTLAAKEDTALKAYFKQQGLSQEEVELAIGDFKAQKTKNQPDIGSLQNELAKAKEEVIKATIQNKAILHATSLGIDAKSIPYILKMADFTPTKKEDGSISDEDIAKAIQKVLEDVPALKPSSINTGGFTQVGASQNETKNNNDALRRAFGL